MYFSRENKPRFWYSIGIAILTVFAFIQLISVKETSLWLAPTVALGLAQLTGFFAGIFSILIGFISFARAFSVNSVNPNDMLFHAAFMIILGVLYILQWREECKEMELTDEMNFFSG